MQNTKILIQIKDINISFEGSEEFVRSQLKDLKQTLSFLDRGEKPEKEIKRINDSAAASKEVKDAVGKDLLDICEKYPVVFAEGDEGEIKVIYTKLGKNEKSKTENLVLLYAIANESRFPEKKIPYQKLSDQKKEHGIIDKGGNFSSYVKGLRGDVIFSGKNSAATVRLTAPGREKAQKLCDEILKEYEPKS